jgi:hypothetical protein
MLPTEEKDKTSQIIDSSTHFVSETIDGLSKSKHAVWQLPIILFSMAIALSIAAIAFKFDPNMSRNPVKIEPTVSPDIYKGLKRPEYDDLKFPLCTRRGEGFNCET